MYMQKYTYTHIIPIRTCANMYLCKDVYTYKYVYVHVFK